MFTAVLLMILLQEPKSEPKMDEAKMKARIIQLSAENKKLAKLVEKTEKRGFISTEREIESIAQILNELPNELEPKLGKWTEAQFFKVKEHLKTFIGREFRARVDVSDVIIRENKEHFEDESKPKYVIRYRVENKPYIYKRMKFQQKISSSLSCIFYGDEEMAKAARALKKKGDLS